MGIAGALTNLTMVVFPFLTGAIHDQTGSYVDSMVIFVLQDAFCVVLLSTVISQRAYAAASSPSRDDQGGVQKRSAPSGGAVDDDPQRSARAKQHRGRPPFRPQYLYWAKHLVRRWAARPG